MASSTASYSASRGTASASRRSWVAPITSFERRHCNRRRRSSRSWPPSLLPPPFDGIRLPSRQRSARRSQSMPICLPDLRAASNMASFGFSTGKRLALAAASIASPNAEQCEQDAGGASARGVIRERRDAAGHRRGQLAVALAIDAHDVSRMSMHSTAGHSRRTHGAPAPSRR